jgi:hypothetical protein
MLIRLSLSITRRQAGSGLRCDGPHDGGSLGAQSELKYGPAWAVRHDPQSTLVRLDNCPANRQAHSHAICFCGEERAEYPIDILRIDFWVTVQGV